MKALSYYEIKSIQDSLKKNSVTISILLDRLEIEENIAHIFRLSDSLAVTKVFILEPERSINWHKVKKISRQCTEHVSHQIIKSLEDIDHKLYHRVAVEWTDQSINLTDYNTPARSILLIVGNEKHGISQNILDWCNESVHIDMYGQNSSMNVAMAAGIVVHNITIKSAPRK